MVMLSEPLRRLCSFVILKQVQDDDFRNGLMIGSTRGLV